MTVKCLKLSSFIFISLLFLLLTAFPVPGNSQPQIIFNKDTYAPGEAIIINYSGLPGNAQDWITLIKNNMPHDKYGQWFYTQGKKQGSYTFRGMAQPGVYEVRIYYNWPAGGYNIQHRQEIRVGQILFTDKSVHEPGEPIIAIYNGFPGNAQDWITIIEKSARDDKYGQWIYLKGKKNGRHTFTGPGKPGEYELRGYYNWPQGGYDVRHRFGFTISGAQSSTKPQSTSSSGIIPGKDVYAKGEPITIEYSGLPGNQQDWITIIKKGMPDNKYGQWFYTKGQSQGTYTFNGINAPGEYEIRVYHNWPNGGYNVQERIFIRIE